jgi:hypothetical protein
MRIHRENWRIWPAAVAVALATSWNAPASADWSATLPLLAACSPATAPELPPRWRAVALMMPFLQGQIDVGEVVYDSALPALRATIYGLKSGTADLLITHDSTYVLVGPHQAPTQCISLGPRLHVPTTPWLTTDAVCLGESPLAGRAVQWWNATGFELARYWIAKDTRLPWRSLFLRRSLDPAVIGDYAMSYFPAFTPLPETNLSALRDFCAAKSDRYGADVPDAPTARDLMVIPNSAGEAERSERIAKLIPGLSYQACSRMTPIRWPDHYVTTAMITPIKLSETPFPALVYYDWTQTGTQLILPFAGRPPTLQGLISLKKNVGYRMVLPPQGNGTCTAVFPGLVRPDWMTAASCECQGVIEHNPTLSPNADSQILSCPIKAQARHIMWNWYSTGGRPLMFTEAMPGGGGVMLADYHDWLPGEKARPGDLELPSVCVGPENGSSSSGAGSSLSNVSCSDCHTTPR